MKQRGQLAIWLLSIILFGCPFIFYYLNQKQPVTSAVVVIQPTQLDSVGLTVHVSGELQKKGIYKVAIGTKVYELIDQLNLGPNAAIDHLNLAKTLTDGQKIVIKSKTNQSTKLNINFATQKQLKSLPGIGEVSAQKIMTYRQLNGTIKSFDELLNILSKKQVNKIKSKIEL